MRKSMIALVLLATAKISAAPQQLITRPCQSGAGSFGAFPGEYALPIKIGERVFMDKLSITSIAHKPGMPESVASFAGVLEVPGIFTSQIEEGVLSVSNARTKMEFKITARENGQDFAVYYVAEAPVFAESCIMRGQAFSPTRDKLMGSFRIHKNTVDCSCTL